MICQDSWVYVTEPQIKCLSKKGDNGAIMKSQSELELSQCRASPLSPCFPFSASFCVSASFSQASCSHRMEPRTQGAPGLDPSSLTHREKRGFSLLDPLRKTSQRRPLTGPTLGTCPCLVHFHG